MKASTIRKMIFKYPPALPILLALAGTTQAAEYYWRADWGVFPDQVDSTMRLGSYRLGPPQTSLPPPVLTNGELVIHTYTRNLSDTDTNADYQYYDQAGADLTMPTQLVVEAEVRFESGITTFVGRPPTYIVCVGAANVVGMLGFEDGSIFLGRNQTNYWSITNVPTSDAFHLYRVEIDNPAVANQSANQLRVFRDGVLVLNGPMGGDDANVTGTGPEIYFGDGTDWAFGISHWKSFRHNAATQPSKPVMFLNSAPDEVLWTSHSNVIYTLQYATNLLAAVWTSVVTNVVGIGTTNSVPDAFRGTTPQGYYRVQMFQ